MNKLRQFLSRVKIRKAIIVSSITGGATIVAALITTGQLTQSATADPSPTLETCDQYETRIQALEAELNKSIRLSISSFGFAIRK